MIIIMKYITNVKLFNGVNHIVEANGKNVEVLEQLARTHLF